MLYLTGSVDITGTANVGETLTADTSSLGGTGVVSYQWRRGNSAATADSTISGATSQTYTLTAADQGKYISVRVSRDGYSGTVTSNPAGPVLAAKN